MGPIGIDSPHVVKPNLSSLGPLASFCIFSHLRASTASLLPWTATRATSAAPSAPSEPSRSPPTPGRRARPIVRPQPPRRRPSADALGRRARGYKMGLPLRLRRAARVAFASSVAGATFVWPAFRMAPFKPRTLLGAWRLMSCSGCSRRSTDVGLARDRPVGLGGRQVVRWRRRRHLPAGWPPDLSRPVR